MVEKNKVYDIRITGMAHQGFGVGKVNDFVVFVEGALTGEYVKAKIVTIKKDYAYALITDITEKSKDRAEPFCPVYEYCGGCSLQHMSYESQLVNKTDRVYDCFKRIGGFEDVNVFPCIGMENPYEYRNKVQLAVSDCGIGINGENTGLSAGFYARRTHKVVSCDECKIQPKIANKIKESVLTFMKSNGISVYDEITHKGLIRHVMVRKSVGTGEIMVVIVATENNEAFMTGLTCVLTTLYSDIKTVVLNINRKITNVIMGDKCINYFGNGIIREQLDDLLFNISALSFFQVNTIQMKVLYDIVKEYASLTGNETVLDLYCGAGTIGLYLAKQAKKIIGIETVPQAVENAKDNAAQNNIKNAEFITGKSEDEIQQILKSGIKPETVIVDPPRKGCHERLLAVLCDTQPEKIIYVSCNPSTLARDCRYLADTGGYRIDKIQPVDMFPFTEHVETVVLMSRVLK